MTDAVSPPHDHDDHVDFDSAVGDPAAYYAEPQSIVADDTLSREQKKRFLTEWAQDIEGRISASDEGQQLDDNSDSGSRDAALLQQINAGLEQVEESEDNDLTRPLRLWWKRWKSG
ncbi:hypothetical protein [Polymorphobacter sp.]|uniref:hypothetical protein n=1 Tax=Polymorphobacter sp. TaxID=1909290 RepID=UPI003F6FD586